MKKENTQLPEDIGTGKSMAENLVIFRERIRAFVSLDDFATFKDVIHFQVLVDILHREGKLTIDEYRINQELIKKAKASNK